MGKTCSNFLFPVPQIARKLAKKATCLSLTLKRYCSLLKLIQVWQSSTGLNFLTVKPTDFLFLDSSRFHKSIGQLQLGKDLSVFTERTEDSSASQYFQFYAYLSQQQNMMQDYIRTSTYQRAILSNMDDFKVSNWNTLPSPFQFWFENELFRTK